MELTLLWPLSGVTQVSWEPQICKLLQAECSSSRQTESLKVSKKQNVKPSAKQQISSHPFIK